MARRGRPRFQAYIRKRRSRLRQPIRLADSAGLESERNVVLDRHMREERVVRNTIPNPRRSGGTP